jgi:hypothetical protein
MMTTVFFGVPALSSRYPSFLFTDDDDSPWLPKALVLLREELGRHCYCYSY